MSLSFALLLLASTGPQGASLPMTSPPPDLTRLLAVGCVYAPISGTDEVSRIKGVVNRFNAAVTCGDLATAQALVAANGTVSEIDEDISESGDPSGKDGRSALRIDTGPWAEQLVLLTRALSDGARERIVQGRATILVDGASALVRLPITSETVGRPPIAVCVIQHMMLADDGQGWKIRHMMLVPVTGGCKASNLQP